MNHKETVLLDLANTISTHKQAIKELKAIFSDLIAFYDPFITTPTQRGELITAKINADNHTEEAIASVKTLEKIIETFELRE